MAYDYSDPKVYLRNAGIAMVFAFPASLILRAYTLSVLWFWFAVPLGIPAVGMAHALGLVLMINFFIPQDDVFENHYKGKSPYLPFIKGIVMSISALSFGALWHSLM